MKMTPLWWGRSLYYYQIGVQEPIGVVLAMQSTQEGQQPALNTEVVLPALSKHYGFAPGSPEIEFFNEHAAAECAACLAALVLLSAGPAHATGPTDTLRDFFARVNGLIQAPEE